MNDENTGKYRKRLEDETEGGITRREDLRLRPEVDSIALQNIAAGPLRDVFKMTPLADQIGPFGEEGELVDESLPDFGLGSLVEQQRSERCRESLDYCRKLIGEGRHRQALAPLEDALTSDPYSSEAIALKVRCLVELGHNEAALRVARMARSRVEDPELRFHILRLESVCVRALTRALEDRLGGLIEEGRLDEALSLVQDGLRQQPSNIVFLYHLADLHWARGEQGEAVRMLEEARRHVGRENIDLIVELERKITFSAHRDTVENARLAVRRGDPAAALAMLDSCRELKGNEHYDDLRRYAEEKARSGLKLFFASKLMPEQGAQRQQTLRWLVAEEFHAAEKAQRAGRFSAAREALTEAARLEPACRIVPFRHAAVIVAQYRQASENKRSTLRETVRQDLELAESMVKDVASDPEFTAPSATLLQSIQALREKLVGPEPRG